MWSTAFEYYLYYTVFWNISQLLGIVSITTYMLLFYSAYTVPLDPHIVYYLIFTIYFLFLRPINRDYSRLSFNYITYSADNTGKRCVFVVYLQKGKCYSLIFILLIFCLSHQNNIQNITRWLFIIAVHFLKRSLWYWSVFIQYSYYCALFCMGPA